MYFKSAYIKLTLFYVLIVMIISISFSVVIFRISSNELGRGLSRQSRFINNLPPDNNFPSNIAKDFDDLRIQQFEESAGHLRLNLIYFNLLILILATGVSYYFARRTLRPIEEMMEAQNNFTADASHELRTPLTAMRTEIEVSLRDKKMKLTDAQKLLKSNLEEINKLETLSSALLELAKYDSETDHNFEKISLTDAITDSYQKIENLADKKNIKFENDFTNLSVLGDKQSLVQLFVILFDNAIKYSPKNSKISITIKKHHKDAKITIIDQGIGIKDDDLKYIFNRFYRSDTSRTKGKSSGYGLGLSIAKRIVEIHNGSISVESKIGVGSKFIINLPIAS